MSVQWLVSSRDPVTGAVEPHGVYSDRGYAELLVVQLRKRGRFGWIDECDERESAPEPRGAA